jgi:hypothetical protein
MRELQAPAAAEADGGCMVPLPVLCTIHPSPRQLTRTSGPPAERQQAHSMLSKQPVNGAQPTRYQAWQTAPISNSVVYLTPRQLAVRNLAAGKFCCLHQMPLCWSFH